MNWEVSFIILVTVGIITAVVVFLYKKGWKMDFDLLGPAGVQFLAFVKKRDWTILPNPYFGFSESEWKQTRRKEFSYYADRSLHATETDIEKIAMGKIQNRPAWLIMAASERLKDSSNPLSGGGGDGPPIFDTVSLRLTLQKNLNGQFRIEPKMTGVTAWLDIRRPGREKAKAHVEANPEKPLKVPAKLIEWYESLNHPPFLFVDETQLTVTWVTVEANGQVERLEKQALEAMDILTR